MIKHNSPNFGELELVKEYPTIIAGKFPLRLYRTKEKQEKGETQKYRYHFGFPEKLVKVICPLLESTPYWGETHWFEHEGFWIWWLAVRGEEPPWNSLNKELTGFLDSFNKVLHFYRKMGNET